MTTDRTGQEPHWDREQWAKDEPVDKTAAEQGKTWNRHEWASADPDAAEAGEEPRPQGHGPDETGPTGRGMPPGESHWERVEPER
jgi:hypothetical protein